MSSGPLTETNTAGDDLASPAVRWWDVDHHWSGWTIIATVLVSMTSLTWRTWPDPMIDFGRELYVPWRILEGQILYQEIAYHNGPLSPHVNAAWFAISGVSLTSLLWLNFGIVLGVVALLRSLLRDIVGGAGGTIGCVTFLGLFGFSQYTVIANYNWMCPYSHEMTHGIALSLLAIHFVRGYARCGRGWYAVSAGFAVGLVFLTKAEIFVAGAGAVTVGLAVVVRARAAAGGVIREALRCAGLAFGGVVAPALIALAGLMLAMPFAEAARGTLGTWVYVFDAQSLDNTFMGRVTGLDNVSGNAGMLCLVTLGWVVALLPAALAARVTNARWRRIVAVLVGAGYAIGVWLLWSQFPLHLWLRPLPLILLVALWGASRLARLQPMQGNPGALARHAGRLALLVLATLLLIKIALFARVGHYGFGLAMPGTALMFAALCGWVPRALARRGWAGSVFATAAVIVWLAVLGAHIALCTRILETKTVDVGTGSDAFRADARGHLVQRATHWIRTQTPHDATLTTLIDCEMLNYLTRRTNPLRYGNFNPQQLQIFGEQEMRSEFERRRPDYIALVHRETSQYGFDYFGRDYGQNLFQWISANYRGVHLIGAHPFRGRQYGILLEERVR